MAGTALTAADIGVERPGDRRRPVAISPRWLPLLRLAWLLVLAGSLWGFVAPLLAQLREPAAITDFGPLSAELIRNAVGRLGLSPAEYQAYVLTFQILEAVVFYVTGVILFRRKSSDRIALVISAMLVAFPGADYPPALAAQLADHPVRAASGLLVTAIAVTSLFSLFFIFPDGRFVPRWTRLIALLLLLEFVGSTPGLPFADQPIPALLDLLLTLAFLGCAVYAQVYRYRRVSGPLERQQTKWAVLGLLVATTVFVATNVLLGLGVYERYRGGGILALALIQFVWPLAFLCIPVSLAVAVLQFRLFDLDMLVSRALLSLVLTTSVAGFFVLVVAGLGALLRSEGLFTSLAAAGLVAVLFQPWRERLQHGINHLLYGERDDPYTAVSRLSRQLEGALTAESLPPAIVKTVASALRVPYVALEVPDGSGRQVMAATGQPTGSAVSLQLAFRDQPVGTLVLAPRSLGEQFNQADRRLLDDLARQAGVAVHAVRLTLDLQRAREQLISAREEERRRLRRDLHDGLGSQLAALVVQSGVLRTLIRQDPAQADEAVAELRLELRRAIADIRRLVEGLRPPALDELGLAGALRQRAARYGVERVSPGEGAALVRVEAAEPLGPLPAAVEVAAYRIVEEAMTNVQRHAQASSCLVRLTRGAGLVLEISDDGVGFQGSEPGVGLQSMRERAEELGGTFEIDARIPSGTVVRVRLPLSVAIADGVAS